MNPKTIFVYAKEKTDLIYLFLYLQSKGFIYDTEWGYKEDETSIKISYEEAIKLMNEKGGTVIFFNPEYDLFYNISYITFKGGGRLLITNMPTDVGLPPEKIEEKMNELMKFIIAIYQVRAELCELFKK